MFLFSGSSRPEVSAGDFPQAAALLQFIRKLICKVCTNDELPHRQDSQLWHVLRLHHTVGTPVKELSPPLRENRRVPMCEDQSKKKHICP